MEWRVCRVTKGLDWRGMGSVGKGMGWGWCRIGDWVRRGRGRKAVRRGL